MFTCTSYLDLIAYSGFNSWSAGHDTSLVQQAKTKVLRNEQTRSLMPMQAITHSTVGLNNIAEWMKGHSMLTL